MLHERNHRSADGEEKPENPATVAEIGGEFPNARDGSYFGFEPSQMLSAQFTDCIFAFSVYIRGVPRYSG
jgi:hypothetical protein